MKSPDIYIYTAAFRETRTSAVYELKWRMKYLSENTNILCTSRTIFIIHNYISSSHIGLELLEHFEYFAQP